MKSSYRSILVLTATIMAVSLYAYLGPDPKEQEAEELLEAVVASSVNKIENGSIDPSTGLPVLKIGGNELVFTADIPESVASKLMEHLVANGFLKNASSHKMILGREPNNYIIFFATKNSIVDTEYLGTLKKLLPQLSSSVFNHQPVVIKVINEKKDVQRVNM